MRRSFRDRRLPQAEAGQDPYAEVSGSAANLSGLDTRRAPTKSRRSVFGPAPARRPDMLTHAETIVLPWLKGSRDTAAGTSAAGRGAAPAETWGDAAAWPPSAAKAAPFPPSAAKAAPFAPAAVSAEAVTQILTGRSSPNPRAEAEAVPFRPPRPWYVPGPHWQDPPLRSQEPPPQRRELPAQWRERKPAERYTPSRRVTRISRLVLLAILCLQAVMSLRLHNSAFEDEATYLYAGHMELEHLLHGSAPQGDYASYFSGSPVLYPVAAAALDQVGGLAAARALSLVEMLMTTALLYSLTRRLFNERSGLCAAALFAVTESTIFLGNFATYDATCLSLLAGAAWIMVRTASCRWPAFLIAAPLAALAVGVKYAGLLFVPTIALLPVLAGWPERGRRVLLYPVGFGVAVAGILLAALRLGGPAYMAALQTTTTNRVQGATAVSTILRESLQWGGVLFAAAVFGGLAYVRRVRTDPDEKIAPAGGPVRRAALGAVLTGTALLAPAYQAHLHTDVSFLKHIGFGLFFAAPMAGFGLARLMGDYFRRPQFGVAVWSLALVVGLVQSNTLYHEWPSSGSFVSAFSKYLQPGAMYMVEVPEVPIYYLMGRPDAQPDQFISTYYLAIRDSKGQVLTGPAAYTAAVEGGYFQVIAYNGDVTPATDAAIATALKASHSYYLAATVHLGDAFGPVDYYIWVKGHAPAQRASSAVSRKA